MTGPQLQAVHVRATVATDRTWFRRTCTRTRMQIHTREHTPPPSHICTTPLSIPALNLTKRVHIPPPSHICTTPFFISAFHLTQTYVNKTPFSRHCVLSHSRLCPSTAGRSPPTFFVLCCPCPYISLMPHNVISPTTFWLSS